MGLFQVAHLRSGAAPLQCARSGLSTSPPAVIRPFTRAAAAPRATPRPSRSHYVARRRPQRLAATPADPAPVDGNGSSNGSGNGGGGGGGSGGGDDAEGQSQFNANIWLLTMAAAAALGLFKVGSKRLQAMQQQQQARATAAGATAGAAAGGAASGGELDTDDVRTLTRLTQEAFAELVKVRARLDELEEEAGIAGAGSAPADASLVSSSGGAARGSRRRLAVNGSGSGSGGQHQPRHRLAGVVRLGGGAMWAQDGAPEAATGALQAAGVKLGTDVLLQLSGVVRGGRDSVHAECKVDPAAEQLTLRKVLYSCRLGERVRLMLAPFGARGRDAAYTLNPLAGQGLTSMLRDGSPLHAPVLGSLAGVALESSRAWLNAGYFSRAAPEGAAAASVLAQAVVAPTNNLSAGMTYLEHRSSHAAAAAGPSSPPPQEAADAGAGGPALVGALQRVAPAAGAAPSPSRQLGTTLAWRLGDDAVLHGWAAADADEVERRVRGGRLADVRPWQWGLTLGSYPDGSGNAWAASVGHSAAAEGGGGGAGGQGTAPLLPNLYELSLQFNLGDGLALTPGLVVLAPRGGRRPTAFLGARTAWAF